VPFTGSEVGPGFAAGSQVASYRIVEEIGRGGMAVVYRARDDRLDRWVALKILSNDVARNRAFRQRFIRESRAAAAVDHPNILPIFDAGEADGVFYIAMRYLADRDLGSQIDRVGPLPLTHAVSITTQVASALDAAHAAGLVHRDVKPANILLGNITDNETGDHVYLTDFGISLLAGEVPGTEDGVRDTRRLTDISPKLTVTEDGLGTISYASPEQILGRPLDGRADAYSLACVFFEMLSGKLPFNGDYDESGQLPQFSATPPKLTRWRPDLPPAVDQVLAKGLSVNPDDRYDSCRALAAALAEACGVRTAQSSDRPNARPGHRWLAIAAACVAVLAVGGGAWALLGSTASPSQARAAGKTTRTVSSPSRPVPGPAAVVQAFFAAIDNRNYPAAWRLWGIRAGTTYQRFESSYAATKQETVSSVSTSGDTVTADLTIQPTTGTTTRSHGHFVVQGGVIVAMSLTPYATVSPVPSHAAASPAPSDTKRATDCTTTAIDDISADCYTASSGTITVTSTDDPSPAGVDGNQVAQLADGDYLEYPDINFGSGSTHFTAQVACGAPLYASGGVEVVLDNPDNTPVAGFSLANTGGWNTWKSVGSTMTDVTGIHNVYIVLKSGGPAPYLSLHYFTFG
jgi:tRNA A-37 threonylcarbamoyl transferase component Bud32